MTVRAKFRVTSKDQAGNGESAISLQAVVDGSAENKEFFKYTPSGAITMGVVNGAAAAQFEIGKEYFVDFTPA